jgi:hypothetical protein
MTKTAASTSWDRETATGTCSSTSVEAPTLHAQDSGV